MSTTKVYISCFLIILLSMLQQVKAQHPDAKPILLKNVTEIPLPDSTTFVSILFTTNADPEVIATAKFEVTANFQANVIASSVLGNGKVIVFGSDAYFKDKLLKNQAVAQLMKNIMTWGSENAKRPKIGIFSHTNTEFARFLKKNKASTYEVKDFKIAKNTDILFLAEDVKDSVQQKMLEAFISSGGTLIFASPYDSIFKNRDTTQSYDKSLIKINDLLGKAGLFNAYTLLSKTKTSTVLNTDSVPNYLHINTMLPLMLRQPQTEFDYCVDYYAITPAIGLTIAGNELGSPILEKIKEYFRVPDTLAVPTPESPVKTSTPLLKVANNLAKRFYEKQHPFGKDAIPVAAGVDQFPGAVPKTAERVNENLTIKVGVGTQGLAEPNTIYYRPHTTGMYVPAGEKVEISIPKDYLKQNLKAQVGIHHDDLSNMDELTRIGADLTRIFPLEQEVTEVFSPYGGLLLINISDTTTIKNISITVKGAVKAPHFRLGQTNEEEWKKTIRNYTAPWAELATDKIVLTVPSYRIRSLDNPEKLMKFWDEVMDADADLAMISRDRVHQERIIVDRQVAYGYMFTLPERIVVPDDRSTEWMLDEAFIRKNGSWGHFHELGHRHQFWGIDFDALGEVTVNLYSMYIYDKVLHKGIYNHDAISSKEAVTKKIKNYLVNSPSFEKWSADPFLALSMYIQLIEKFGWDAFKAVHTKYRNLPKADYPKTNQDKIDFWFLSICEATKTNLTIFFDIWKVPVTVNARQKVVGYKSWLPSELMNR